MGITRRMDGDFLVLENPDSGASLRIEEMIAEGQARISPAGRLTMEMVHDLEDEMTSMVLTCNHVVLDLTGTEYIANSALRMILEIQHMVDSRGGTLKITGVGENLWDRFEEMGLEEVFALERVQAEKQ